MKPTRKEPVIRFDGQLMAEDMAAAGWTKLELARRAKVADFTVTRFLRGDQQSAPTAKKLAKALGQETERYLIRLSREEIAS